MSDGPKYFNASTGSSAIQQDWLQRQLWGYELSGWLLGFIFFAASMSATTVNPNSVNDSSWLAICAKLIHANTSAVTSIVLACFWWAVAFGSRIVRFCRAEEKPRRLRDPLLFAILALVLLFVLLVLYIRYSSID